jgi:hypothetical protein
LPTFSAKKPSDAHRKKRRGNSKTFGRVTRPAVQISASTVTAVFSASANHGAQPATK